MIGGGRAAVVERRGGWATAAVDGLSCFGEGLGSRERRAGQQAARGECSAFDGVGLGLVHVNDFGAVERPVGIRGRNSKSEPDLIRFRDPTRRTRE